MKLFDETQAAAPAVREQNRSCKWTVIAQDGGKGLRFMIDVDHDASAAEAGRQLCAAKRVIFVAVFKGHMAALEYC